MNQAEGGARCNGTLSVLNVRALDFNPRRVILGCGINDIGKGLDPRPEFTMIHQMLTAAGVEVIIVNVGKLPHRPELDAEIEDYNNFLRTFGSRVIDYNAWTESIANRRSEVFGDNVHPNKQGYKEFAEFMFNGKFDE